MNERIKSLNAMKNIIYENDIAVILILSGTCSVCSPFKEKIKHNIDEFDNVVYGEVYIEDAGEISAEYQVFTAPIALLFVQGKEAKRYSAAMDMIEFKNTIDRYIKLM